MAAGQRREHIDTIGLFVAVLLGAADLNWWVRLIVVCIGLLCVADFARNRAGGTLSRLLIGGLGAAFLVSVTWPPIWKDFHEKYPSSDPVIAAALDRTSSAIADFQTPITLTLAGLGMLAIGWGWHPIWSFRRRTVSVWRHALNQRVWISKDGAIDLVRRSEWANTRQKQDEPPRPLFGAPGLGSIFGQIDPKAEARVSMFIRWCELALESFGRIKFDAIRKNEAAQQEYDQDILKEWLAEKYELDVLDRFGPI